MRAKLTLTSRDIENNIVFLKDMSNQFIGMSITNDAENVVNYYRSIYGNRVRVVYEDTENELWEIVWVNKMNFHGTFVSFKPWYGLAWDILSRKENV